MASYNDIIGSDIFTFVVGPSGKEYHVHSTALSRLSKPLSVLIQGDMREAKEKCIKWPDVDEKTFVRFIQWAYTKTYVTEEPDIILDPSLIGPPDSPTTVPTPSEHSASEMPLYSLITASLSGGEMKECCWNEACTWYGKSNPSSSNAQCPACLRTYSSMACASCNSVYNDCPNCGPLTRTTRNTCAYTGCSYRRHRSSATMSQKTCLRCRKGYSTKICPCQSAFSDCGECAAANERANLPRRHNLVNKFLDELGTTYPTSTVIFLPRKNTEGCEEYTNVFLCHAKLYVLGDIYDIPALKQLSLHRLHATLKQFTLYPSRMNDIAVLTKYIFENTFPDDKIRDMITLYYACIVEDAREHDGLKSLIDEIPGFAFGLISKISDRLS